MRAREHDRKRTSFGNLLHPFKDLRNVIVLLCGAPGCISASISPLGASLGVLQAAWKASWQILRVYRLLLGTYSGALRERLWGLFEPLRGLLRKKRGLVYGPRRP